MAAEIISARLDDSQRNVIIKVRHGGACGKHDYSLALKGCAESFPVQCQADLVHQTDDMCEAILQREATISLAASGIVGSYYSRGSLTINGENDSKATIRLPDVLPTAPSTRPTRPSRPSQPSRPAPVAGADARCLTHTGSVLTVQPSKSLVTIQTASNETASYSIVDTDVLVFESIPAVLQHKHTLNDGRKVVTEFRDGEKRGSGYFIRTNGDSSPEFDCVKTR